VVVMGPPTHEGWHPATVRVRNVTDTGFEFQIDEWDYLDGAHALEDVVPIRRRVLILAAGLMVVELQMGLFLVFAELLPGLGARLRAGAGPDIAVRIPDRVLSGEATRVTKPIASAAPPVRSSPNSCNLRMIASPTGSTQCGTKRAAVFLPASRVSTGPSP